LISTIAVTLDAPFGTGPTLREKPRDL